MPSAEFVVLEYAAGSRRVPIALLLLDETDRLRIRQRDDLASFVEPDDVEVLDLILTELQGEAARRSGSEILRGYEDTLSNTLQISDRCTAVINGPLNPILDQLFAENVHPGRQLR